MPSNDQNAVQGYQIDKQYNITFQKQFSFLANGWLEDSGKTKSIVQSDTNPPDFSYFWNTNMRDHLWEADTEETDEDLLSSMTGFHVDGNNEELVWTAEVPNGLYKVIVSTGNIDFDGLLSTPAFDLRLMVNDDHFLDSKKMKWRPTHDIPKPDDWMQANLAYAKVEGERLKLRVLQRAIGLYLLKIQFKLLACPSKIPDDIFKHMEHKIEPPIVHNRTYGSLLTVNCKPGWGINTGDLLCQRNQEWSWSTNKINCELVDCGTIPTVLTDAAN